MKTVAIVGSPRKEGNCDLLVKALCDKVDGDVESFFLNDLDVRFCDACLSCKEDVFLVRKGTVLKMMI